MTERDYEAEAAREGWVPQEKWKGDPEKWKPAKDFVEAGENILPIVKSKLDRIEKELEHQKQSNKQFGEYFQDFKKREEKEKSKLIEKLEATKKQAVTDGDGEAFMQAEQEIASLQEQNPVNQLTADQQNWLSNNEWYGRDDDLTIYADGVADRLVREGYADQSPAYFAELSSRVKGRFPDSFGNKNRDKPAQVETAQEKGGVDSKAKTYDNLPPEAKAACDRFVNDIPGFKVEDYVSTFDWEQANV